jgi:death-on-curing protein
MREWRETRFGIDDKDLLESALNRLRQAANFDNAGLAQQAASLCFGLIKNHPWVGGNKRTASFLMEVFLELNGSELNAEDGEIVQMVLKVESNDWETNEISEWLSKHIDPQH